MILGALDQSIVNTALPRIASDLGGLAHLSWVVTAFMLSSTIVTPIYGKLSDMYGPRRFLFLSIAVFIVTSALCGAAQSMTQLIAFRLLQGLGAGGLMTLSQTVVSAIVSPRERTRYQGLFTGAFALSSVTGPLIGGGLTTAFSWHWVFYVNIPVGLLALTLILIGLKPIPSTGKHHIDVIGALLLALTAAIALLLFSWAGSTFPWFSLESLGLLALTLVLLALFIKRESVAPEPLISLSLFRIPAFTIGAVTTGCMSFAMMGAMVFMPLYFQLVLGHNPAEAGLLLLPQIATMLVSSIFGGRLSAKLGRPKIFMVSGIFLEALGLSSLSVMAFLHAPQIGFLLALAILGLGMGVAMPNATVIVQNAVASNRLGVATSSMSFIRSLGGALGVSVSGGVMSAVLLTALADVTPHIDPRAIIDGGARAIADLSPAARAAVAGAFGHAIAYSFMIGGCVMTLALMLASTLKGTDFKS